MSWTHATRRCGESTSQAATTALHELREEYEVLTRARSSNGHATNPSGFDLSYAGNDL